MKLIHVSLLTAVLSCAAITNVRAEGWTLISRSSTATVNTATSATSPYTGTSKITATGVKVEVESKNMTTQSQSQTSATFEGSQSLNYDYVHTGPAPTTTPIRTVEASGSASAFVSVVNSTGFGTLAETEVDGAKVTVSYPYDAAPKEPAKVRSDRPIGGTSSLTAYVIFATKAKTSFAAQGTTGTCLAKTEISGVFK